MTGDDELRRMRVGNASGRDTRDAHHDVNHRSYRTAFRIGNGENYVHVWVGSDGIGHCYCSGDADINGNAKITFSIAGTEKGRFDATGFGIGVTPSDKLHVKGTLRVERASGGTEYVTLSADNNYSYLQSDKCLYYRGLDHLFVRDAAGNCGVIALGNGAANCGVFAAYMGDWSKYIQFFRDANRNHIHASHDEIAYRAASHEFRNIADDAYADILAAAGTFAGNASPSADTTYDLGDSTHEWKRLFAPSICADDVSLRNKADNAYVKLYCSEACFAGHIFPSADNTYNCGTGALAWAEVNAYVFTDHTPGVRPDESGGIIDSIDIDDWGNIDHDRLHPAISRRHYSPRRGIIRTRDLGMSVTALMVEVKQLRERVRLLEQRHGR